MYSRNNFVAVMSEKTGSVSPEQTDFLGAKAAQMAIDANIPLPDAVVKVALAQGGLNNTHIGNICWMANNEYFRKVAAKRQEAGENMVFDFPLADPSEVTKRVNSSAQPKVAFVREHDYKVAPPDYRTKTASDNSWVGPMIGGGIGTAVGGMGGLAIGRQVGRGGALAQAAGAGAGALLGGGLGAFMGQNAQQNHAKQTALIGAWTKKNGRQPATAQEMAEALGEGSMGMGLAKTIDKVSEARQPYSLENPMAELGELRETLFRARDLAAEKSSSLRFHTEMLEKQLYSQVKQAALEGSTIPEFVSLFSQHRHGQGAALSEIKKIAFALAKDDSILFKKLSKTAEQTVHGLPDTSHPLYSTYSDLRQMREDSSRMRTAHKIAAAEARYAAKAEEKGLAALAAKKRRG